MAQIHKNTKSNDKVQDSYTITIPKRKRIPESLKTPAWYRERAGIKIAKCLKMMERLTGIVSNRNYDLNEKDLLRVLKAMQNRVHHFETAIANRGNGKKYTPNKVQSFFS